MFKLITEVQIGDVIKEGSGRTTVKKIEVCPSSRGTKLHINEKDCYESFTDVQVQESKNTDFDND